MIDSPRKVGLTARLRAVFFVVAAFVCAAGLSASLAFDPAWADVRKTDVILGQNVESRGLQASQCPSVDAEYALLIDKDGKVFFERGATEPAKIASMTKIMTAIVALENSELTDTVVVDYEAATVGEASASLLEGDSMDMKTALYALLVPSGNDAAIAIAKTVGAKMDPQSDDPEAVFVEAMNRKAAELGCRDTVFENPHGLDHEHFAGDFHSTAADMGVIVRCAMDNEQFRSIVGGGDAEISVTSADGSVRDIALVSTDELVGVYDGICGVKTGTTEEAGYCFAGAVVRDEGTFYSVVMNSPSSEQRFQDTVTLMDWAYEHLVAYPFENSTQSITSYAGGSAQDVPLIAQFPHSDWIDRSVPVVLAESGAAATVFDLSGNISQSIEYDEIHGDVHAGDVVGTITFLQRNQVLDTIDLVAAEDVAAPTFFEGVGIWWDRLFRGFSGDASVADEVIYNETPILLDKTA